MKKFFVTMLSLAVAATAAFAQDYNAAMEAYNNAAVAETKADQIAGFREAMNLFAACAVICAGILVFGGGLFTALCALLVKLHNKRIETGETNARIVRDAALKEEEK